MFAVVLVTTLLFVLVAIEGISEQFYDTSKLPANYGKVNSTLYPGSINATPLVVTFGGSEGGNFWANDNTASFRGRLYYLGLSVLSIAYFGEVGTPERLDRISLEGIHKAIRAAAEHPKINGNCIALLGYSKGAELALALGSHYPEYRAIIAFAPSGIIFPATTNPTVKIQFPIVMNSSSFALNENALPFAEPTWSAKLAVLHSGYSAFYESMLENPETIRNAAISVERINGPILLISAQDDQLWPSETMSEMIIERLKENNFRHSYYHLPVPGNHWSPITRFDRAIEFLNKDFIEGCKP